MATWLVSGALAGAAACGAGPQPTCEPQAGTEKVALAFRSDGVEGASNLTVKLTIGSAVDTHASVSPGTLFDLGQTSTGGCVSIDVSNGTSEGAVRANILVDNCFVASAQCEGACTAHAEAQLARTPCVNY